MMLCPVRLRPVKRLFANRDFPVIVSELSEPRLHARGRVVHEAQVPG